MLRTGPRHINAIGYYPVGGKMTFKTGILCGLLLSICGYALAQTNATNPQGETQRAIQSVTLEEGVAAYDREDYNLALTIFLTLAKNGNASAQFDVGLMYQRGKGVPEDLTEAFKWYRLAAEQGHADAQFALSEMYREGRGVAPNRIEANKWNRIAVGQGYSKAQQSDPGILYGPPMAQRRANIRICTRQMESPYCNRGLLSDIELRRLLNAEQTEVLFGCDNNPAMCKSYCEQWAPKRDERLREFHASLWQDICGPSMMQARKKRR